MAHKGDGHKGGGTPEYHPTAIDLAWAKAMIGMVKEGGLLIYPSTGLVYKLFHKKKEMVLRNPEMLLIFESFVIHFQTIDVFKALGWKVKPGKEEL